MIILSFIAGLAVGIIATILVFRKNKGVQASAEQAVDSIKTKIDN